MIYTYTGRKMSPIDPRPDDINIKDIAHALACCNRFAGHARWPISVAQHSVYASYLCVGTGAELQALLHDASEAYLGDVTKWVKQHPAMEQYREAEYRLQRMIYTRFGCPEVDAPAVWEADNLLVRYELYRGFGNDYTVDAIHPPAASKYPPLTSDELCRMKKWYAEEWSWREAESAFLKRFHELTEPVQVNCDPGSWEPVWQSLSTQLRSAI